jgi:hypothetical protein
MDASPLSELPTTEAIAADRQRLYAFHKARMADLSLPRAVRRFHEAQERVLRHPDGSASQPDWVRAVWANLARFRHRKRRRSLT